MFKKWILFVSVVCVIQVIADKNSENLTDKTKCDKFQIKGNDVPEISMSSSENMSVTSSEKDVTSNDTPTYSSDSLTDESVSSSNSTSFSNGSESVSNHTSEDSFSNESESSLSSNSSDYSNGTIPSESSESNSTNTSSENTFSSSSNDDPFDLDLPDDVLWNDFLTIYNKTYSSPEEEILRNKQFARSLSLYRTYNLLRKTENAAVFGVTQYSDMLPNELFCTNPKMQVPSTNPTPLPILPKLKSFPLNFSRCGKYTLNNEGNTNKDNYCTDNTYVGCDGCYVFSAIEMASILFYNKTSLRIEADPFPLFDCVWSSNGCCGGDPKELLLNGNQYFYTGNGEFTDTNGVYSRCNRSTCVTEGKTPFGIVKNIITFASTDSSKDLKTILLVYGPFISTIRVDDGIQGYKGGVLYMNCSDETLQLANVIVVGYGTEPSGEEYFIIRNYWGDWGEEGYMRVSMTNLCGVGQQATGKEATNYIIQAYFCVADPYCLKCDTTTGKCIECGHFSLLDKNGMCSTECPEDCLTCDKELTKCYTCKNGAILEDDKCVFQCPDNCKTCDRTTMYCTSCNALYELHDHGCRFACTESCKTCNSELQICQECKDNSVLQGSICMVTCPEGCKTCDRITQVCYSCQRFYKLSQTKCVPTCRDKCTECNALDTECVACEFAYVLYNGSCYSNSCKGNCQLCDLTTYECEVCKENYFPYKGKCYLKSDTAVLSLYIIIGISTILMNFF
ncbi:viral cathepsin, putative [Entamoeba invadens IP1]|uniref:Viral cathepsin, putative n=1 Tax=Entamoeba invadens IP1 TaxID=370355 RepID=A0A0A1TWK5_ENTIV|nr:viral cathepsin, putative [Entamoeba invadens IP1]ELP85574.1 viral cathepsin, putative [Entamoeba invadens IP1]|eukprot:XP_004184920.1 viral cathepsin, putative [Entamoeba invadens IP1]